VNRDVIVRGTGFPSLICICSLYLIYFRLMQVVKLIEQWKDILSLGTDDPTHPQVTDFIVCFIFNNLLICNLRW